MSKGFATARRHRPPGRILALLTPTAPSDRLSARTLARALTPRAGFELTQSFGAGCSHSKAHFADVISSGIATSIFQSRSHFAVAQLSLVMYDRTTIWSLSAPGRLVIST